MGDGGGAILIASGLLLDETVFFPFESSFSLWSSAGALLYRVAQLGLTGASLSSNDKSADSSGCHLTSLCSGIFRSNDKL